MGTNTVTFFGITFEQGRNNFKISEELLKNIVTENKNLSKEIINCCEREIVYNKNLILEGLLVIYKKNRS